MSTEGGRGSSPHLDRIDHTRRMMAAAQRKRRKGQDASLENLIALNAMDLAQAGLDDAHRRDAARREEDTENEYQ